MDAIDSEELAIGDLVSALRRQRLIVYAVLFLFLLLGGVYCLLATRRYSSTGTIELEKQIVDSAGLQNLTAADTASTDALESNIDLQTQANILQSDAFALAAIQNLHLLGTHDYPVRQLGSSLSDSPARMRPLLERFHAHLKVNPVGGTRLIEIEFLNPDPAVAAKVVNFLIDQIRSQGFRARNRATAETSDWLAAQLSDLRRQSEAAQAKVVALQRETGVYNLGTVDAQGHEQSYSGALDQLEKATSALNQAEQNRIVKQAIAESVEHGNAASLSSLAGNGSGQPMESMAVIQNLRQREASQAAALVEAQAKFGSSWPKVIELQANIHGLEQTINEEFERIRSRARSDYQIALRSEADSRTEYEHAKRDAARLNDKAVEFAVAKQEADQSRQLYDDVLKRFKEAAVLDGWRSSNITIIDGGREAAKPKTPNVPLSLSLALLGGLFFGCASAIAVDLFDSKLKSVRQIERFTHAPVYGVLPRFRIGNEGDSNKRFIPLEQPNTPYAQAVRRMSLKLLAQRNYASSTVILVTSPISQQGKTLLSASLASALALAGHRVLLVDADLRHRELSHALASSGQSGMNELLNGRAHLSPALPVPGIDGLDIVGAGTLQTYSSIVLNGPKLENWIAEQRRAYGFVILDSSDLLSQTEALALYPLVDLTLVLVKIGHLELSQAEYSIELLKQFGPNGRVGVVVGGLDSSDAEYAAYFGRNFKRSLEGKADAIHA